MRLKTPVWVIVALRNGMYLSTYLGIYSHRGVPIYLVSEFAKEYAASRSIEGSMSATVPVGSEPGRLKGHCMSDRRASTSLNNETVHL